MAEVKTPVANPVDLKDSNKDDAKNITDKDSVDIPKTDDKVSYETHRKLLDEKKKLQQKYEKMVDDQEKDKQKKLEEQGKYQELYDTTVKENTELKNFKTAIEASIQAEIESELENVDETIKEMIQEIPDLSKKLAYLKKLKKNKKVSKNSPVSDRAGGDMQVNNINLADYRGPEGRAKLIGLQKRDPKLFQKILELKSK